MFRKGTHPYASSVPPTSIVGDSTYRQQPTPFLHTSIIPPIGALPPKPPPPRVETKAPILAQPPTQGLSLLAILEGRQQLSFKIEVQVIFSFPPYLPFLGILLLCIAFYLAGSTMHPFIMHVDGLRAMIVGAISGFLFRSFYTKYSSKFPLLSSPNFPRFFPLFVFPTAFCGHFSFLIAFIAASCVAFTPIPNTNTKQQK